MKTYKFGKATVSIESQLTEEQKKSLQEAMGFSFGINEEELEETDNEPVKPEYTWTIKYPK